jgi:glycosyltransferase involved in cell wall biosynthesis
MRERERIAMFENDPLSLCIASCTFDSPDDEPDALLERYHAMTGWARAAAAAGAASVHVVQRCRREAFVRREGASYHFVADAAAPQAPWWFWSSRMAGVVGSFRPDVVHVDGLGFPLMVRRLRLRLPRRTAVVVQDHGGFDARSFAFRTRAGRALYRLGLGGADGFLFTAAEQAARWQHAGILSRRQSVYEVLEASTDLASSRPVDCERLPGRPAVLWVARLDANKDPLTVLDGFERAATTLPDAALTMVYGEDDLLEDVRRRLARSSLLSSRVYLRGKMKRGALPALYAGADLFMLGSHREVACFALLEALSFGVTPVVSDIPAFRTITGCGTIGALFPPGDSVAVARCIVRMASGDLAARRQAIRAHFDRSLSWEAVGRRALAIYRQARSRRARGWM